MEPDYMRALKPDYDNFIQMPEIPTNVPRSVYNGNCIVESDSLEDFGTQQCKNGVPQKDLENQNDELFARFDFNQAKMTEFDSLINKQQLGGQNEVGDNNSLGNSFTEQILQAGHSAHLGHDIYKPNKLQSYNETAYQNLMGVLDEDKARYYQFTSTSTENVSELPLQEFSVASEIEPHPQMQDTHSWNSTYLPEFQPRSVKSSSKRPVVQANQIPTPMSQSKCSTIHDRSNEMVNCWPLIPAGQQLENEEQPRPVSVTFKEDQPYPSPHFHFSYVTSAAQKNLFGSNYQNPGYYCNQTRQPPPPYKQVEKQPDSGPNSAGASCEAQVTSVSSSRANYADVQNVEYNSHVEPLTSHESDDRLLSLEYDSFQESPADSQYVGKSKNAENCAKSRLKKKALFKVEKGKADILLKCLQFVNTSTEITMSDNARRIVDTYMNEANNLHWKPILDRMQTEKEQKELLEKTTKTFKTGNQVTTNKMKRANFKHVK